MLSQQLRLSLLQGLGRGGRCCCRGLLLQQIGIETRLQRLGITGPRIGPRHPVQHMEQLSAHGHGIMRTDRSLRVGRLIPGPLDRLDLVEQGRRQQLLEARLVDQGPKAILIGTLQAAVVVIEPLHRLL